MPLSTTDKILLLLAAPTSALARLMLGTTPTPTDPSLGIVPLTAIYPKPEAPSVRIGSVETTIYKDDGISTGQTLVLDGDDDKVVGNIRAAKLAKNDLLPSAQYYMVFYAKRQNDPEFSVTIYAQEMRYYENQLSPIGDKITIASELPSQAMEFALSNSPDGQRTDLIVPGYNLPDRHFAFDGTGNKIPMPDDDTISASDGKLSSATLQNGHVVVYSTDGQIRCYDHTGGFVGYGNKLSPPPDDFGVPPTMTSHPDEPRAAVVYETPSKEIYLRMLDGNCGTIVRRNERVLALPPSGEGDLHGARFNTLTTEADYQFVLDSRASQAKLYCITPEGTSYCFPDGVNIFQGGSPNDYHETNVHMQILDDMPWLIWEWENEVHFQAINPAFVKKLDIKIVEGDESTTKIDVLIFDPVTGKEIDDDEIVKTSFQHDGELQIDGEPATDIMTYGELKRATVKDGNELFGFSLQSFHKNIPGPPEDATVDFTPKPLPVEGDSSNTGTAVGIAGLVVAGVVGVGAYLSHIWNRRHYVPIRDTEEAASEAVTYEAVEMTSTNSTDAQ